MYGIVTVGGCVCISPVRVISVSGNCVHRVISSSVAITRISDISVLDKPQRTKNCNKTQ